MEEQQQPINLDNEDNVEQPDIPAVGDKRTADIWHKYNDIRDPKTQKVVKAQCKKCDRVLKVETKNVASESAFSTFGRVIDDFRSSLGVKTVEALVCTQDWLRGSNVCIDLEQLLNDVEKYEQDIGETIEGISGLNLS